MLARKGDLHHARILAPNVASLKAGGSPTTATNSPPGSGRVFVGGGGAW